MLTAIWAILIFCVLIFIHEFGHFITAKMCKMTVHEFAIGMGPKLFSFGKKKTKYSLRALPLGGFVSLEGEDGDSNDPGAFCNNSAIKRFVVLFAGAFMNVLLGFLIFVVIFSTSDVVSNTTGDIVVDSPFDKAGIQKGDVIVYMDGETFSTSVHSYNDISLFMNFNGGQTCEITFERNGKEFTKTITPEKSESGGYTLGFMITPMNRDFFSVISGAFWECVFVIKSVFLSIWWLITGVVPASDMSGPVGIVSEIGRQAQYGWRNVLNLAGFISVNLGVMNLLPIPALDGGRILFLLIEKIRGKKMKPETEGTINFVFFAILIMLMLIITFSDIKKIL